MSPPFEVTTRHFDPHIHGRLMPAMEMLIKLAAQRMCGGSFEPNTFPTLLLTADDVARYLDKAHEIAPDRKWSASIYMTRDINAKEVARAWKRGILSHVKRYPTGGSTHSDLSPPLEMLLDKNSEPGKALCLMAEMGIPYKSHGEVVVWDGEVIHPDHRESVYYLEFQRRFIDAYPGLRKINAHITTATAARHMVEFGDPDSYICEVTAHHLMADHRMLYDGGFIIVDHHCLPVLKDKYNWNFVRKFFAAGHDYVVAASDMADHDTNNKYAFLAFGGFFTYHCSLELYVQALWESKALEHADKLLYGNAKRFFGKLVPDNPPPLRLIQNPWRQVGRIKWANKEHTPFGYHPELTKSFEFQFRLAA